MSNIDEKLASIPTSPLLAERMTKKQPSCENDPKIVGCSDDTISRQAVIDLLKQMRKDGDMVPWEGKNVFAGIRKLPSAQPDVPDTNVGDMISRQAAIDALYHVDEYNARSIEAIKNLPPAQPERTCVNCGRTANNGGWYEDGGTRCPIEEHYALPKDGYCHLWEKRNVTDDNYPERREE